MNKKNLIGKNRKYKNCSEEQNMQKNKLNNVIVLKEISSNIVEEAIVVLKPNVSLNQEEINFKKIQNKIDKKLLIIEEAEKVIKNYIVQLQSKTKEKNNQKLEKKYNKLKKICFVLAVTNLFCIFCLF